MEVSPQDEMANQQGTNVFAVARHGFLKISCIFVLCNGRSLSGMGLTQERWCCTGCWLSKLDMNAWQTSIKTDVLF